MRYRRAGVPGASYFFTVNLAERSRRLLVIINRVRHDWLRSARRMDIAARWPGCPSAAERMDARERPQPILWANDRLHKLIYILDQGGFV